MQVKKQQLELDMEQWTGSKLGKEYIKAIYCHPAYLTYVQSTSCKMPGWMKHISPSRLRSRGWGSAWGSQWGTQWGGAQPELETLLPQTQAGGENLTIGKCSLKYRKLPANSKSALTMYLPFGQKRPRRWPQPWACGEGPALASIWEFLRPPCHPKSSW